MSNSLKMELIKEFEEGNMDEKSFGIDSVNYSGITICKIIHDDGKDKVFGFEPHRDGGRLFFFRTLYSNKVKGPWFRYGQGRVLIDDFIRVGI